MKKLIVILCSFVTLGLTAQNNTSKAKRADSLLTAFAKQNKFTGSVLIAQKGKVLLSKGYGMADIGHDVPNTSTTKFKLASVSKQFTAMAIMILQEKGK